MYYNVRMAAERTNGEGSSDLQIQINHGFEVANAVENEANLSHIKFESTESVGSKIYWHERESVLRVVAENIQNQLSFLVNRLREMGSEPED